MMGKTRFRWYNDDAAGSDFEKGAVSVMCKDEAEREILPETAAAAEMFAKLPADSQDAIISLIKSLLSER